MEGELTLEDYSNEINQMVIHESKLDGQEYFHADKFTENVGRDLLEGSNIYSEIEIARVLERSMGLNGFSYGENKEVLDLFIVQYFKKVPPKKVRKGDVERYLKKLKNFFLKSLDGLYDQFDESTNTHYISRVIFENRGMIKKVRLFYLTDGILALRKNPFKDIKQNGQFTISHHLWDIQQLYKLHMSGYQSGPIKIDFVSRFGTGLPCIEMPEDNSTYTTYLTYISGDMLADLYNEFNTKLLERNVRSFLQFRGNINKGIRNTIQEEPDNFLAYNNGLSVTAKHIDIGKSNGITVIKGINDFQIVNGGQTTASLYTTKFKDKYSLEGIHVQTKITVFKDTKKIDDFAPKISEYSNTQNKVSKSDLLSNHEFHVGLEKLSRSILAPHPHGGEDLTYWFYERARGQYLDEKGRKKTRKEKKTFENINPRRHMFTKTDLAKFVNTWQQIPYMVSRGAQKNFEFFMEELNNKGVFTPQKEDFKEYVALAIIFKETERIVSNQPWYGGGIRAHIVTYTIAHISHQTGQCIDLDWIWKHQSIPQPLRDTIERVAEKVNDHLNSGEDLVTEWAKKPECWESLLGEKITLPPGLSKKLVMAEKKQIKEIMKIHAKTWFDIYTWAEETENLQLWQRGIANSLGKLAAKGKDPSIKQAKHGETILDEARRAGLEIKYVTKEK